jgi:hypothetical protein
MKTLSIRAFALTVVAVSAIGVPGCKKDNSTSTGYEISVASKSGYGQYLVDKDGRILTAVQAVRVHANKHGLTSLFQICQQINWAPVLILPILIQFMLTE